MSSNEKRDRFNVGLCKFIAQSPTPFHAVATLVAQLEAAGFQRLLEGDVWDLKPGARHYVTRNDSAIVAFVIGDKGAPQGGLRMVGAHTDSPCLVVKPEPVVTRAGYLQLGVQVYGGALLNPWFDRDLSLAGRVSYRGAEGRLYTALIDFHEPLAIIPSLAIHLDRDASTNRTVNAQKDILPILCIPAENETFDFRTLLHSQLRAEHPDADVHSVLDYELSFYDTQAPALVGLRQEFIAAARLDNLLSCYVGIQALIECDGTQSVLFVANDHEEVGSMSASGAQGTLLNSAMQRLVPAGEPTQGLVQRSLMISTDNAHGVHPNFADRHDKNHGPLLNGGPVIKVNASQRYASNAETSGLFRLLAQQLQVPVQSFAVRSDMACGSTIGPITAGVTGVRTLDVGVPTFAMHSIRELAGVDDAWRLCRILAAYYDFAGPLTAQ